ncbi:MAG: sigma-E processing peptidase SpoIIGA [Lachnospiraceae bacterium]|jgi:stage II sporulation protein GA (sporulation sigma-E factor processing peptidase)|nr:sigma-E processing peptidase SpoIIGA [Lachnospiraceae bacterium]
MEITFYLDVFLLVNFFMDFFLLWMLSMILKLKGKGIRLAAGSAVGAFLSALAFLGWMKQTGTGIVAVFIWSAEVFGISSLMVIAAFRPECFRDFIRGETGLLFGAALAAGVLEWGSSASLSLWGRPIDFGAAGLGAVLFALAGSCLLADGIWNLVHASAAERSFRYQVTLFHKGRQVTAEGFLDTGNRLRDPVSGRPVHVADRKILESICPRIEKLSMIPYRTIDGGGAVLKAVTIERMEAMQGKHRLVYERPLVAASPRELRMKNGCRILLHE